MSYDRAISQLRNSVSRPTLYRLQMPGRFIGRDTNDYLEYFCNAAQIPSVRYNFAPVVGHSEQGITRLQPVMPVWTNPLQITVIENSDFDTFKSFKDWFDQTGQGISQDGQRSVKLRYYSQITGDIQLTKLEFPNSHSGIGGGQLKEVLTVKFLNAYIKSVGPVQLNSDARDTFLTFPLEFNYESYTTE